MTDDSFDRELENLRRRRLEDMRMSAEKEWPSAPVNVTDGEFQDFVNKYPRVIIDCWAPWCGPCRMLGPVIDELAGAYKGKVAFGKLNTDDSQATAMGFGIQSIPTLLFFRDGKLVSREVGALPRQALEPKIKAFVG